MPSNKIPDTRCRDDHRRVLVGINPDLFCEIQHVVNHADYESAEEFVAEATVRRYANLITEVPPYTVDGQPRPETTQQAYDQLRDRVRWYGLGGVFWDE